MIAILIAIPILFMLIFGFMSLGIYAAWHDFDKPKNINFFEHICKNKKEIVKSYAICSALWIFSIISLLIMNCLIN